MKKKEIKDQEQKGKPRRLRLNRETILALDDPALLELVIGGIDQTGSRSSCPNEE